VTASNIAEQLQHLALPVAQLQLHPRNPREGDVGAIIESLAAFGQQKPVVAQRRAEPPHIIIAGNHLYRAALELQWPEVAAVVAPMDDQTAMRFLIADNRTQERGTTNAEQLAELLAELAMQGALDATGYDGDDVDDLLKLVEHPPDLAGLAAKYGDGEDQLPESFWPRISLRVETEVYSRWNALWNELGGTDSQRLARIIELAYDAPDMAAKAP
jgi:hypothetical protein